MFVKNYTTGKCYSYGKEITAEEYAEIMEMLKNPPEAPEGYVYTLNENLEWELYEVPVLEEEEPTAEDYEAALAEMGVEV